MLLMCVHLYISTFHIKLFQAEENTIYQDMCVSKMSWGMWLSQLIQRRNLPQPSQHSNLGTIPEHWLSTAGWWWHLSDTWWTIPHIILIEMVQIMWFSSFLIIIDVEKDFTWFYFIHILTHHSDLCWSWSLLHPNIPMLPVRTIQLCCSTPRTMRINSSRDTVHCSSQTFHELTPIFPENHF